jgi:hypothetical protein
MTASAFEMRSASLASAMTINGMTTGNVDRTTTIQTPNAPCQSRRVSLELRSAAGDRVNSFTYQLELRRLQSRSEQRRQLVGDQAVSVLAIGRFTYGAHRQQIAPALADTSHQIHSGIDNSPGYIASERREQHRPYRETICRRHTDRARDGQGHYQTEQDFGEPFDWLKHPAGQSHEMSPDLRQFERRILPVSSCPWSQRITQIAPR